jgi:hypothetical protein
MTAILPEHLPSSSTPLRIQSERLRRLGTHLKGFLDRYQVEPQTREDFLRREMLRSGLQSLERRCAEFRVYREKEGVKQEKCREELAGLLREFRNLEIQIKGFMHRQRTR